MGKSRWDYPIVYTRLISVRNQLQQRIRYRTLPLNFAYLEAAVFSPFRDSRSGTGVTDNLENLWFSMHPTQVSCFYRCEIWRRLSFAARFLPLPWSFFRSRGGPYV